MSYYRNPQQSQMNVNKFLNDLKNMTKNGGNLALLIKDPDIAQKFLKWLNDLGFYLKNKNVKTSQIRKMLERVRKLYLDILRKEKSESMIIAETKMLATLFAYDAGRHPKQLKDLYVIIKWVIDNVKTSEDVLVLKQLAEGITAFHKYHGGGD